MTAINGGTAAVTASLSGGNLVLTGNNDLASVTVSGTGNRRHRSRLRRRQQFVFSRPIF